jgi:hypothetical protein
MRFPLRPLTVAIQRMCHRSLGPAALIGLWALIGHTSVEASDTIYFRDGMRTVCEGNAWEKGDEIHCEYDGGLLIYPKSDVAHIEKGRSVEPELDSPKTPEIDPPPAREAPSVAAPASGTASSATPRNPSGIAFYDPRRTKKYWSSETRHHDTFRDAISALSEEFNRPAAWIEENLGDSNELSDVRENLKMRLSGSAAANATSAPTQEGAIEFYNPRRNRKYMTGPEGEHDSFQEALDALANDFNKPADWVEQHMGESNDVDQIRKNLKNAQEVEIDR